MNHETCDKVLGTKMKEIRTALGSLGKRLDAGDDSEMVVWVIPGQLACAHRPLRYHPTFGVDQLRRAGAGRDLPPEATAAVIDWVDKMADRFRSLICLMHPKEIAHYAALQLPAADLIEFYRTRDIEVCHLPWDDPAHRPAGERAVFKEEKKRVSAEALECFDRLPRPVLLHCSAGIDRSSPVAAFIWSRRSPDAAR